jgi:glyoxylase-like metal-dependent hydrolase (beta-lactamase superfamily II)
MAVGSKFLRSALVFLCALPVLLPHTASAAGPASAAPGAQRIANDIYVFPGAKAAPSADNLGRVANVGVIVGSQGVIVIGTGTSDADGERLLSAIGRVSALPVVLAIDTYAGPEHVLGNSAFARRGIPLLAHRATDDYMARNCELCQRNLERLVGDRALAGSRLERPQRLIDGSVSIVAGGRQLRLLHYGHTQQAGSIAVFDTASGVLFAGGLASFDVVPEARDAELVGWINALREIRLMPIKCVVPGRGPPGDPDRLDEVSDYLAGLARDTQHAYDQGLDLAEATTAVTLPRFAGWVMYEQTHRRNVHFQYLRLEARELAGTSGGTTGNPPANQ